MAAIEITSKATINTENAHGIYAQQDGKGGISIISTAEITTKGSRSHGIYGEIFFGTAGAVNITSTAEITTKGYFSHGILSFIDGSSNTDAVNINSEAAINTEGESSHGINGEQRGGTTGTINITSAADITAIGLDSDGLRVLGRGQNNHFSMKITGGTVLGGWNAGSGINTVDRRGGGTIDIQSGSTLSALSDRAI